MIDADLQLDCFQNCVELLKIVQDALVLPLNMPVYCLEKGSYH